MDDLKPIIWTIFIVIYIASRFFKKTKKHSGEDPAIPQQEPDREKEPESLLDTIREEIRRQQELAKEKERQEQAKKRPQPVTQKPAAKISAKKAVRQPAPLAYELAGTLDTVGKEGVSAFAEATGRPVKDEPESVPALEFDPRQAFMMKTLLERHPMA